MQTIKIAIKEFVSFIGRSGSISNDFTSPTRAIEGTRIHQMLQANQKETYHKEYYVTYTKQYDDFQIILSGRADGVVKEEDYYMVDEIKSTTRPLDSLTAIDTIPSHLNQAKCYAYIIACENNLKEIDIQLTYYQIDTNEIKQLKETFLIDALEMHFNSLLDQYYAFAKTNIDHIIKRNKSIKKLEFPFKTYREGQREMAISVYNTIKQKEILFIQAATGIGKTISTIYPALKSIQKGYISKIMYLTAKTITRSVAEDTTKKLYHTGCSMRVVTITAKDKICFLDKSNCHKDYCPYALNHYDRINAAILDCLENEALFTREVIETYALKHQVCPFELSLDLFLFSDISISDYNYAFDPKVSLKRAEDQRSDYVLLVDESHNLVDRSKEMYSFVFSKELVMNAKRKSPAKKGKLYQAINKLNSLMNEVRNNCNQEGYYITNIPPQEFVTPIHNFHVEARKFLLDSIKDDFHQSVLELYFHCLDFIRILDLYGSNYITYIESTSKDTTLKLFCIDSSQHLKNVYQQVRSTILFSATLLPITYFYQVLGGDNNQKLYFPSPFPKENKQILIAQDISTRYRVRHQNHHKIIHYIKALLESKKGNYLIYFPSYAYMNQVLERISFDELDCEVYIQSSSMSEEEKDTYLKSFDKEPNQNRLFFGVLGGVFAEGIDLKNEKLIGTIIVSVGLPQICLERDLIKDYFNKQQLGYLYSYVYPGFNKVMQAAGRVIRTIEDKGVIVLLDDRYLTKEYLKLFPVEWHDFKITDQNKVVSDLKNFWKKNKIDN